ncbi:MAG: hypothetical protein LH618_03305 [Saprospiraceae bacterium]|nr:hypothetical protein [Saprospiraceae bacterium]
MKPFIFLAGLLLALAGQAAAQTPGYLGKRFFVKSELPAMFAFSRPTASNHGSGAHYGEGSGNIGFNTRPGIQVGYAVSRRHVLAFEAGYLKTGMLLDAQTPSLLDEAFIDAHTLFYHLSGLEYGLAWQTYNPLKASLAPKGLFTAWHVKVAPMKGKIVDKQTSYGATDLGTGHAPLGIDASYVHWSAGLEFGQHLILFDRLLLSISAEINVPPLRFVLEVREQYNSAGSNQQRFNKAAFDRMQGHSLFMVKLGAGYLF